MIATFVDTSAFFALLAGDDAGNERATRWLDEIASRDDEHLLTHDTSWSNPSR